jgi:hypothetical protein
LTVRSGVADVDGHGPMLDRQAVVASRAAIRRVGATASASAAADVVAVGVVVGDFVVVGVDVGAVTVEFWPTEA